MKKLNIFQVRKLIRSQLNEEGSRERSSKYARISAEMPQETGERMLDVARELDDLAAGLLEQGEWLQENRPNEIVLANKILRLAQEVSGAGADCFDIADQSLARSAHN